jgi:quinol monooxygenase YgiN
MVSQPDEALYVVTHVDVMPPHAAQGAALLREFAVEVRHDARAVRFEIVQEAGRPNHFTILSAWQSRQAFEAHETEPHTIRFREKLHPLLGSPFDERLHLLLK